MRIVHIQVLLYPDGSINLLQKCFKFLVNSYGFIGKENMIKPKHYFQNLPMRSGKLHQHTMAKMNVFVDFITGTVTYNFKTRHLLLWLVWLPGLK